MGEFPSPFIFKSCHRYYISFVSFKYATQHLKQQVNTSNQYTVAVEVKYILAGFLNLYFLLILFFP